MHAVRILLGSRIPFSDSRVLSSMFVAWICLSLPAWAWAVQVSPSSLSFSATQGGANPQIQSLSLSQSKRNNWSARANVSWVNITPASGSTTSGNATISIGANVAGLAAGTHSATVTIQFKGGGSPLSATLPVTLVITSGSSSMSPPIITLTPASLQFSSLAGGANPAAQNIGVSNTGAGTLSWTTSKNAAWLTLSPATGTNTGTVSASVSTAGLAAGTYNATVTISATGSTKTVPVTLTLTGASSGTATLTWLANQEPNLAGYKVYVGTRSGVYGPPISLGKVLTYQVNNLKMGTTYFFTVTAYDSSGTESEYAAEVSKSIF